VPERALYRQPSRSDSIDLTKKEEAVMRTPGLVLVCALLAGCWNGNGVDHVNVDLGAVSLGQQLLDLQRARDAGAIDDAEFAAIKRAVLDAVLRIGGERDEKDD
jgi:hypothetical protein